MANPDGLCVVTAIVPDDMRTLRRHLAELPRGPGSPLARVEGTHFARWQIVRLTGASGKRLSEHPAYLVFASEHDGPAAAYVEHLCAALAHEAHEIWEHCEGYPGRDAGALARYLLDHRITPGYSVAAYPGATLDDVQASLALRDRLDEFVIRTRHLDAQAVQRAWLQQFRRYRRSA